MVISSRVPVSFIPLIVGIGKLKYAEFLSVPQIVDTSRAPHTDLPFPSLSPQDLDDRAQAVENAVKDYKASAGISVDEIPWIGLPKTFWYWTSTMWHYNKSLVILPCAVTEPKDGEMVRVAVEIARRTKVPVSLPYRPVSIRSGREADVNRSKQELEDIAMVDTVG